MLFKNKKSKEDEVILKLKFRTQPTEEDFEKIITMLHSELEISSISWKNIGFREISPEVKELRNNIKEIERKLEALDKFTKENK